MLLLHFVELHEEFTRDYWEYAAEVTGSTGK